MSQPYILSLDYLRTGENQKFTLVLSPEFMDIQEKDLSFEEAVSVEGEAYLVEENLVIRFDAHTKATMPCVVCNRNIKKPLAIKGVYHTVALEGISGAYFDFRPALREELLVELPKVAECGGNCSERASISPYLKSEKQENYFPFSDLK